MQCPKCGRTMKYDIKTNEYYCEYDGTIEENEAFDEGFIPNSQFSSGFSFNFSEMNRNQQRFNDYLRNFLNYSYFSTKNYKDQILFQFKKSHFLEDFDYGRQYYNEKLAILLIKTFIAMKKEPEIGEIFSKIFEDYLKFVKLNIGEKLVKDKGEKVKKGENSLGEVVKIKKHNINIGEKGEIHQKFKKSTKKHKKSIKNYGEKLVKRGEIHLGEKGEVK